MTSSRIVVVGAGLGGLAAAIRLQAAGHQVTLLEKRAQLGGRAAQLKAGGYTFDMGPSIITAPHLLHDLWSSAGARLDDDVELMPLTPYYRIYFADGRYFDYGGTAEQVEAQLRAFDPTAVDGYHRFMAATRHIYQRAFEDLAGQPFHRLTTFLKLVPELLRLNAAQSVYGFVSRFFRDPQLRTVFSFHPLFIGGNPFRASAIYSIVPYLERQGGVWFARGGMYAVVEAMHALFTRLGGQTRLSTGVAEVLVDDATRRATGVRLDNGESLAADAVVLNADVATAYMRLVPARYRRTMTDRRMRGYRYSMSLLSAVSRTGPSVPAAAAPHHRHGPALSRPDPRHLRRPGSATGYEPVPARPDEDRPDAWPHPAARACTCSSRCHTWATASTGRARRSRSAIASCVSSSTTSG